MRRWQATMASTAVLLGLAGCTPQAAPVQDTAATPQAAQPAPAPVAAVGVPVNTTCPVEQGQKVDPHVTAEYQGKTYAFCCAACPPKFKADPEKYLPNLESPGGEPPHDMSKMKPGEMDHSKMDHSKMDH